jgi:hypothetical protein
MSQEYFGCWECISDGYKWIKKGQKVYPTKVSGHWVIVYIDECKNLIWYLKNNFRECSDDYDPTQVGDRDDDI